MKKTYAYHKPSPTGLEKITELRELFSGLHAAIDRLTPDSREKSVAITQLETAAMWAIKAVVFTELASEADTTPPS